MNNTNKKAESAIFALLKDGFDLEQIKAAYEDGEYLSSIGATEEEAEEVHALVLELLESAQWDI